MHGKVIERKNDRGYALDFGRRARVRYVYSVRGAPLKERAEAEFLLKAISLAADQGSTLDSAIASIAGARENRPLRGEIARYLEDVDARVRVGKLSLRHRRFLKRVYSETGHIGEFWMKRRTTEVGLGTIREWQRWLTQRPNKRTGGSLHLKTIEHIEGAFHTFLVWIEAEGAVEVPKAWKITRAPKHAPNIIDADVQRAILDAIAEPRRGPFLAMAQRGLRPSEVIALTIADYADGQLRVSKASKEDRADGEIKGTKTGEIRYVPVSEELAQWLAKHTTKRDLLNHTAPLFKNPRATHAPGKRWCIRMLRRAWDRACKKVGVKVALYEGTKHSGATALLEGGLPMRALQNLLGHADVRSTEIYAKFRNGALRASLFKIDSRKH